MTQHSQFQLLGQRRFAPFFWTQFFGAFNDNVLKNALVILATYQAARYLGSGPLEGMQPGVVVNLAAGLFILPFFLFSATAGQLADRHEKAGLIRLIKLLEVGIMGLAAWGFLSGSLFLLLSALFLMGLHSTLFGPVKYAILPQTLSQSELVGGNALLEAGTFIAVLAGTITGGYLASIPGNGPVAAACGGVAVALLGFFFESAGSASTGCRSVSPHGLESGPRDSPQLQIHPRQSRGVPVDSGNLLVLALWRAAAVPVSGVRKGSSERR